MVCSDWHAFGNTGLEMHQNVIRDEEALVGVYHYRIAAKYLQAASCAVQAKEYTIGREYLASTTETMRRNPHVAFSEYEHETVRQLRSALEGEGGRRGGQRRRSEL